MKVFANRAIGTIAFVLFLFTLGSFIKVNSEDESNERQEFRRSIIEFRYGSSRLVNTYGGTKNIVRLVGLPDGADQVMLYVSRGLSADTLKSKENMIETEENSMIIGKRVRNVVRGLGPEYVEFKIQTPDISGIETLNFKVFTLKNREKETYKILGAYSGKINNISCLKIKSPVCAAPIQFKFLPDLNAYEEKELEPKTFDNFCEVRKAEARFLHYGKC